MEFYTWKDFQLKEKKILLRLDLNSPVKNGIVEDSPRMKAHASTVELLLKEGAGVVVLAHQSRRGKADFTDLSQHARLLEEHLGREVKFVDDVIGEKAKSAIKELKSGEVLMLDNVRKLDSETAKLSPEEHAKGEVVLALAPFFDYYINDAFSVCHRSQASIVGFPLVLRSGAGPVLVGEYTAAQKLIAEIKRPVVYLIGGKKIDEVFELMKTNLENGKVDKILVVGAIAQLALAAKGEELSESNRSFVTQNYAGWIDKMKELLTKFSDKIVLPVDFAVEENAGRVEYELDKLPDVLIGDIGEKTIAQYKEILENAKTIFVKGPAGIFENSLFMKGTKELFSFVADLDAFSLLGGGHSSTALEQIGIEEGKFSHISLSGGALVEFLTGKPLPGIEALKRSKQLFSS